MTQQRKNIKALLITIALLIFLGTTTVYAAPITLPSGLSQGDQYRLVFVTSMEFDATDSGLFFYDSFVSYVAETNIDLKALGTSWTAIAATYYEPDAKSNTATSPSRDGDDVPIFNLGGEMVAHNYTEFWSPYLIHPIDIFEDGSAWNTSTSPIVWTGIGEEAWFYGRLGGGPYVNTGDCRQSDWRWASDLEQYDDYRQRHKLYAISGILTANRPVPVPSTLILFSSGIFGLLGLRRKDRKV